MKYYILFLILILIFLYCTNNDYVEQFPKSTKKAAKVIWLYWENKAGTTMPYYIKLCHDLIKKYKPVIWIEDFIYNDMNSATQYLINEFGYNVVQEEKDCNFILK